MINLEELEFRMLDISGLETLIEWARMEGWNPGANDVDVFWETDPEGFYGLFFDQKLIAGGAVVSYSGEFGFMGLFIVHPDFRLKGIGKKLWFLRRDLLLGRLNKGAAIGMDGVVDMQPFYEKGGFRIAFRDERFECLGKSLSFSDKVSPVGTGDFEELLQFDTSCLGYDRRAFLRNWISMPDARAFKYSGNDEILGYAVIRKVRIGYKIGPLFANDSEIAEELYRACLNEAVDSPIYLDVPVVNNSAMELVKKYNASYVFECARMYYGPAPDMNIDRIFGITTFELG